MEHKIEISLDYNYANAQEFAYEIGSFKQIKNYNRILDTANIHLTYNENLDLIQNGAYVWVDSELTYVINSFKKIRKVKKPIEKWTADLDLISITIILQKIGLPNKTIRQPLDPNLPLKTVKGEIEKLVNAYGSPFNWIVNYPNENEIVDEYTWTQPTLFECICDMCSDANLTPRVTFDGTHFIINFIDLTIDSGEQFDPSPVSGFEVNGALDNAPKKMINIINNCVSNNNVKEINIYPKSDIGVLDDRDFNVFVPTSFKINKPYRVIVKGNVEKRYNQGLGHGAGYVEFDITDFVLEKSLFDSLPTFDQYLPAGAYYEYIYNYKNGNIYYEIDKKNLEGIRLPYKTLFTIGDGTFSIIWIINYISKWDQSKIISGVDIGGSGAMYFTNDDEPSFQYDVEYKVLENIRYDIIKENGFGDLIQNQNDAYINFSNYLNQQNDLMNRLGNDEIILMGKVYNENDLPKYGQLYGDKLIAQVTTIDNKNSINFMAIATSKYNRVDSDALVNTKKRFFQITTPDQVVERNEFIVFKVAIPQANFTEIAEKTTHLLLETYDSNNNLLKKVYLNTLREKISDTQ